MGEFRLDLSPKSVAERLKKLRVQGRHTQEEISRVVLCTSSHISNVENGNAELKNSELERTATFFKVHPLELIAGLPRESCELAESVAALTPEQRKLAVRLFRATIETADVLKEW